MAARLACRGITVLGIAGQSFDVTWNEAVSADVASARDLPVIHRVAGGRGSACSAGASAGSAARYRHSPSAAARQTRLGILTADAQPVDRSREGVGQIVDA
jgi:hypothetical protein